MMKMIIKLIQWILSILRQSTSENADVVPVMRYGRLHAGMIPGSNYAAFLFLLQHW